MRDMQAEPAGVAYEGASTGGDASWSAVACHRFGLADYRRLRKRMTRRSACSARPKRWQATALQNAPVDALLARLRLLLQAVRSRECRRSLRALRSQAEPGNEGYTRQTTASMREEQGGLAKCVANKTPSPVGRAGRGRAWRGKAVRLATKTSAPAGQAGGGRFDDLSCGGSIRSLRPSGKLALSPRGCPCLTRGQP